MKKRIFGIMTAIMITAASVPATVAAAEWKLVKEEKQGIFLSREYSDENDSGSHSFTADESGRFSVEWDGAFNYGAEQVRTFPEALNWDRYSIIEQNYEANVKLIGNAFYGIHGWTTNKCAEYFVIEGWGTWRPPGGSTRYGQAAVGGQNYDLYATRRYNQPCIDGVTSYDQLWSVRQSSLTRPNESSKVNGRVDVAKHFQAWWDAGLITTQLCPESCGIYVECYGGAAGDTAGEIQVLKNDFYVSIQTPTTTTTPGSGEPVLREADENGVFFRSDFEDSTDGWTRRKLSDYWDQSKQSCDTEFRVSGEKSLKATARTQSWEGACRPLNDLALQPGKEYRMQAAFLQNSESIETIALEMDYIDGADEQQFALIADAKCRKGEWTIVSGTFTYPENASAVRIYVTTSDSVCDFWMDSAILSEKDADVTIDLSAAIPAPKAAVTPKEVQYPARDDSVPYRAHQNKDYTYMGGGTGFKDMLGPYFRVGASVSAVALQNDTIRDFYLRNFNSITCENEMKPEMILSGIGTDDVTVNLKSAAGILKFAEENKIGLRGHNFVWYSQTPDKMFAGTPEESDARIESMIRQTFAQLKTDYPDLKLYAYDVCNEVFRNEGGGLRVQNGAAFDTSGYAKIYGDDNPAYIINAFKWARQYAPAECKLYLNEYNEYMPEKCADLCGLAKQIMKEGDYIDGIGMQSHLDTAYPDKTIYESAVKKFASLGLDIQITELDITASQDGNSYKQRAMWSDVFRIALTYADNISSVTLWQPLGSGWRTLRPHQNSLFRSDMEPIPAYYDILDLTEEIEPPVTTDIPAAKLEKPADYQPLTTKTAPAMTAAVSGGRKGDTNCDNNVDVADVVLLLRYAVADAEASVTDQGLKNGDVNGSGQADAEDATVILRYIAKQITL